MRFKSCRHVDETTRWHAVMLTMAGWPTPDIEACGHEVDWVRRTVRRYNEMGPDGITDRRRNNGAKRMLTKEEHEALREALLGLHADGGLWTAKRVAAWITATTGKPARPPTGRLYLKRIGFSRKTPRPRHPGTDPQAQGAFKKWASWPCSRRRSRAPRSRGRGLGGG